MECFIGIDIIYEMFGTYPPREGTLLSPMLQSPGTAPCSSPLPTFSSKPPIDSKEVTS